MRYRAIAGAVLVLAVGCGREPLAPAPDPSLIVAFDSLWQRYDRIYPYFEYKQIDWDAARARYRPRAELVRTPDALAGLAREMLGELRDVHSPMHSPSGRWVNTYVPSAFINWRRSVWDGYMARAGVVSMPTGWGYARVGRVPYLYFGSWQTGSLTVAAVDSVLELFREAPGLIIDVRMNGGGDNGLAYGVAARFFDVPRITGWVQFRNGPSHSDFSPPINNVLSPRGAWQFQRPVLVLTGRASFSAAEDFVMAMRVLPHVTVAGDTTGGGSGAPTPFLLPGGWSYDVPRWIERTPAAEVVEWRGLSPSIVVPATQADFDAGRDPVMDFALEWASRFDVTGGGRVDFERGGDLSGPCIAGRSTAQRRGAGLTGKEDRHCRQWKNGLR